MVSIQQNNSTRRSGGKMGYHTLDVNFLLVKIP